MLHQGWGLPKAVIRPLQGSQGLQRLRCTLKNRVHAVRRRTSDPLIPNLGKICQHEPSADSAGSLDDLVLAF